MLSSAVRKITILVFTILFWSSYSVYAAAPAYTILRTIIKDPNDVVLEAASVNFRITYVDPVGTCVLYVEDFAGYNMTGTKGLALLELGTGTKAYPVAAYTYTNVFDNTQSYTCQGGGTYNAASNDIRKVIMQFNDGNGWQTLPSIAVNSVPFSMYAETAQTAKSVAGMPTCVGGQSLTFNGSAFSCVAVGTGTVLSVTSGGSPIVVGGTATAPTVSITQATTSANGYLSSGDWNTFNSKMTNSLTSARIWIGNGSNVATAVQISGDATLDNTGTLTLSNSGVTAGSNYTKFNVDAKGRITSASSLTSADISALGFSTSSSLALQDGLIYVGNAANLATGVVLSGDASIDNTGILTLKTSGVAAGSNYSKFSVDAKGRVTSAGSLTSGDLISILGYAPSQNAVSNVGSGAGNIIISMQSGANGSKPAAGTDGRIYVSTDTQEIYRDNGTIWVKVASVGGSVSGAVVQTITSSGAPISIGGTSSDPSISISQATSSASGFLSAADWSTFNSKLSSITSTDITTALGFSALSNALSSARLWIGSGSNQATAVVLSGDATISNTGVLTLQNAAVTRTNLGIGTAAALNVNGVGNALSTEVVQGNDSRLIDARIPTGSAGGDLSGTYPNPILANSGVSAGTYSKVQVDAKGRVISASNLTSADIAATGFSTSGAASQWTTSGADISYISGNVGVGTTSPGSRMEIKGLTTDSSASGLNVTDSAGASKLFVRNDGKIGVGTTSPTAQMHIQNAGTASLVLEDTSTSASLFLASSSIDFTPKVAGNIFSIAGDIATANTVLNVNSVAGATANATTSIYGKQVLKPYSDTIGLFQIKNAANSVLFNVDSTTGNVGIGTTTPAGLLEVSGAGRGIFNNTSTTDLVGLDVTKSSTGSVAESYTATLTQPLVGTIGTAYGAFSVLETPTGSGHSTSTGYNFYSWIRTRGTNPITNAYHFYADSRGSAQSTNSYGLYITDQLATNGWGVYQVGSNDNNYFAGNVGIGTTSAAYKLDVSGDVNVTGAFRVNGVALSSGGGGSGTVTQVTGTLPISVATSTTTPVISIANATSASTGALTSSDWTTFNSKLSNSLNSALLWVGNGSNLATAVALSGDARIDNLGNITLQNAAVTRGNLGLGTAAALNVNGVGNALSNEVVQGNDSRLIDARIPTGSAGGDLSGTYPNPILANSGVSAGTYSKVQVDAKGRVISASNLTSADIAATGFSSSGAASQWTTSGADIGYATGNVGIGTTSPVGILDVQAGTAAASTNGTSIQIISQNGGAGNANGGNIILQQGSLSGTGTNGSIYLGSKAAHDSTGYTPAQVNVVNPTSGTKTAMSILSNNAFLYLSDLGGNFKGQISQSGRLTFNTLNGSVDPSGSLTLDSTSDTVKGNVLINPTGGNVGVGTTAPAALLQVTNTSASNSFVVEDAASLDTSSFLIDASGNVGIGVDPGAALGYGLHIKKNTVMLQDAAGASTYFYAAGNNNVTIGGSGTPGSRLSVSGNAAVGGTYVGIAAPTNGMIVEGNVGIGTATPAAMLQVSGDVSAAKMSTSITTATSSIKGVSSSIVASGAASNVTAGYFSAVADGSGSTIYGVRSLVSESSASATTSNAYGVYTKIDSGGSVVTPFVNAYHFYAASGGSSDPINGYGLYLDAIYGSSNSWGIYQSSTSNKNYFAGNVGIGTTSTAYKLDVSGDINVTGSFRVNGVAISSGGGSGTVTQVTGTLPISVATSSTTPVISIATATSTATGALASSDWLTFNNKLTSTLTSGQIFVGDNSNTATAVTLSGDANLNNLGILTLLPTGVSAGTYTKVTVDVKGRVTTATALSSGDISTALGFMPVNSLGTGTSNTIPRYISSTTFGDSAIVDNGSTINISRALVSAPSTATSGATTINLSTSNTHMLTAVGGSTITLQNLVHGGEYNIIIADPTSRTYTFSGCTNSYFKPANAATTVSTQTIYGFLVYQDGSDFNCYITWSSGFQ